MQADASVREKASVQKKVFKIECCDQIVPNFRLWFLIVLVNVKFYCFVFHFDL